MGKKCVRTALAGVAGGLLALGAQAQTIATANLGANQVTLQLTSATTGTGSFTLLTGSAACGTAAQTVSGQSSTGAAATRLGSLPLTAAVAGSYTVRNLTQSTAYTVCFTPDGTTAPVSATVTTTATAALSSGAWAAVGSAGFSAGTATYESLAFSPNGTPYVAFEDASNGGRATVMEYNGTSWVTVGGAGFSAGPAEYVSLAFSPNGTPYVAYEDVGNGNKATVMEYNGTGTSGWVPVGSVGFSANTAQYESLAFSPNGTPYVAYRDFINSSKATVMEYSGTGTSGWVPVGSADFSGAATTYTSLAFSPNGTPYVAYEDAGNSGKATVMEYFMPPTASTAAATSVAGSSATLNGTVNDEGTATTVTFQYGTTTSYGTTVTATTPAVGIVAAGSGSTATAVGVAGLLPLTTYHYTVSATANGTTVDGGDMTFTTSGSQPTVTGLSPSFGAAAGGGTITIIGTSLTGATAVSFGATAATNVVVVSSTTVTATIPAGTAGSSVNVTVTTANGTSGGSIYTYSALTSYTAPTTAVGAIGATQTAYVNFTAAGTLTTIDVLTLGATGLDFNEITGGTCAAGTTYSIGQVCSVEYGFTPLHPGQRMGAVQLISSAGAVMGTSLISGTGTGPQVVFATTTTGVYLPSAQNTLGGGFSNPEAVAVDGSGNVYVADFSSSSVKEIPVGCASSSCVTTLGSGFSNPTGVAVDGAGNVYVADFGHNAVKEMVAVNGSIPASPTINTLGSGFSQPEGVAVDGSGNVYVGDTSHNAVKEMPSGCASSSCVTSLGGGFSNPSGVTVDGSGNVFVADTNNSVVKEIPFGCASSSCVTTLGSGFNSPQGVAVDGSGNIYVADTHHAAVKEMVAVGGSIPASPAILTLGSGFGLPFGVAVDGSGNVYVADNTNNAVKKLDFADPPSFSFATTYVDSVSADSPKTVTLSNDGNAALTFEVPGIGDNPAISSGFTIGGGSTCPQLTTLSSAGTLAAGASCTDLISFAPQVVGTISGSTVTKDNTLNVPNTTQSVGLSGTSILLTNTITFPQPTTPVTAGGSATLAATASDGLVTYSITSGAATIVGLTITYTNTGTVTIAANSAATGNYAAAATVSVNVVVNAAASSYTAPTEPVGNTSATQTASVTFTAAGTLGSINVVTKGAPNLDFNSVSGGTCVTGTAYTAGQACTVEYSFKPLYPGAREGAVVLQTSGGSVLGTSYLGGTGIAPLGLFTTTSQTLSVSGLSGARGLSTDGYGNLYVLETLNGKVDEIAAGTNTVTTLTTIANTGSGGTAVDGAGNLYVGATGATAIYELVGGKLPAITVVTGTCGSDDNLEVDGAGNLYFSCYTSLGGAIYKVDAVSHALTQLLPGGLGHRFVALAVDAAGNIYAPDFSTNTLYELPFGASSLTTLVTGGALSQPHGVAVDPAGNIYVTNYSGPTNVLRYAADGYALTMLPATGSRGIVIDGSGNLFTIPNDATIAAYSRTTAPGLTFPSTRVGTSSNSSQTVEFENDGNAPLLITDYSATTNFNVGGSGNTCATGTFASGVSCFVGAQLAPTTVGALSGSASIVDNTLNVVGTSQNIPLSGTATLGSKTITFPQPTTPVTVNSTATLTATASNGDAVTYSITSGAASINGTTITYTNAGTVTIAANSAQTAEYAAAAPVSQSITVNAAPLAYTAPTTAVGSTSATQTAMVNFTTAGTPSAISVVTQGVMGLDFAFVSGGTCSTTTAYTVGQSCTVQYTFTPKAPGLRFGGITLSNSSGTLLATSLLAGTGVGPALAFSTSVATNVVTSGLNSPQDVIVDAAGNLYITDSGTTGVVRVAAGSNTPTAYATSASFSSVVEVAIDGAGNLYVTDWVARKVFKVVGSSVTPLVATTFSHPQGIVVDPTGNVFFADQGANTIYKVAPGATSATVIIASTGGLNGPTGLAIDSGGNLYVSDAGHNLVKRIASGATATTTVATTGFTLNAPEGIAVDSAGNLYINDLGNNRFIEVPASGQAPFVLGTGTAQFFMSLDSADRLYAADVSGKVFRFDRTVGTPLAFPNTTAGTSSTAQLLNVENDGNASLAISSIAASNSNFTLAGTVDGSYSACGSSLAYGSICGLGATFTPQSAGTLTANGNVTDNSLNVSGATQTVALSGVATQIPQTIAFTSSAGPYTYGHAPITLSATGGASGNAVTFSLISGPGSVSGSTLTITGAGTIVVAANQAANTNYSAATQVTQTVVVNQGAQAITFTAPASPVTYGAAPSALVATGGSSTKPVVFSVLSGPGSISGSTLSYTGAGTVVIAANQAADVNYTAAPQVTQSVLVNKATPTITWATPAAITYGTPLSGAQLNATASVAGTFSYSPALGVLTAGPHLLSVTFTPTDGTDYTTASTTVTLQVNQATQTITFTPLPSAVLYGIAPITLSATGGGSGNAVVFSVLSGLGSITGNQLTITGTGTVVVAADQLGNANYTVATEVTQSVLVNQAPQAITFTPAPSVVVNGVAPITLSATGGGSGNAVVFRVLSGPGTVSGNHLTIAGAGTVVVAADQLGNIDYTAAPEVTQSVTVLPIAYTAPTEPVATKSGTQTATLLFSSSFTLGSINILTQGAPGLDFDAASGGTCAVGSSYSAGQTCTVNFTFTPTAPGLRYGAVTILDGSSNLQASVYLSGTGTGPLAIFSNGGQSVFQNTPYTLNGVTTDASGNVYYSTYQPGNSGVYEIASGTATPTQLVGGLSLGDGVAIDGAGNVFYSDYGANTVNELVGGTGTPILIASEPNPEGLAFDLQGNLYVAVSGNLSGNQYVQKLLAGSFTPSTTYGTGIAHPQGVAVDGAGNVYITDLTGGQAVVVTPDGVTQTTIATGLTQPAGITLDAAGNIYVAMIGGGVLEEYAPGTPGTYAATTLGSFGQPAFVALDPSGNVLVVDRGANAIEKLTRATPALLSFATTPEGSTSSDSPQTLTLGNDGNASLVLSGLSTASTSFSLSRSSTCTSSTTLASNGACNIAVSFAPTLPGSPLTDAVTITDNNLNAAAVQTVPLSGTGTQQVATVTVAPATISYSSPSTTLSATVAYLGATVPSGGVSFSIDGGSAVPASCTGSPSPLTCTANYPTGTLSAMAHTITATLAADTDYSIASGSATLTVTPIAPTITFAVLNHTYGDAAFMLAATSNSGAPITYSVVSGPATVSGSTLSITGAGPVTVQAAQIAAGNYIAGSQNATFTIAQLALTAAIVNNPTKTYDGTTTVTLTSANYQLTPLVGSDAITVTQPSGVYALSTAGSEGVSAALSATNFSAVSWLLANYILPTTATGPGTITKATASVTPTDATKIYGTADPSFTGTLSGFVATDGVTATYSRTAGEQVVGSPYSISAVLAPTAVLSNYNIAYNTAAFTITPALASVTPAAAGKVYGAADPTLTGTLNGFLPSDNITATYQRGPGETVLGGPYTISALLAPITQLTNYTVTYNTASFIITPAAASVAPAANSKIYGTVDPVFTGTLSGFLPADGVIATYTHNAGETVLGSPYIISATLSPATALSNYTITYSTAPFTILPAPVLITLSNLTQNYSGVAEPVTVTTLPNGVAIAPSYTGINGTVYGPLAGAPTNPGSYSVVETVTDPNYVGQQSGTLTINQLNPALNLTLMAGMPATTPYGTTVHFTLGMASTPQCPTGSVQFYVDGTASGAAVALSGVSCSQPVPFQIATLTPGAHSISAVYTGDAYFISETSAPLAYTVTADATSVTLAASASTVNVGQPLTLTATLTPAIPGNALPPAGTVVFYDGSTPIGTGSVLTATAPYTSTLIVPTLSAGSHSLTATFVDTDGNYVGSSSPLATETVNLNVPTINWTPSPTEFVYGTALGSGQLNATAVDANNNPVAGNFAYNFATGTVLPMGTVNLTATFTPSDPTTYATNSATVTITVDPALLTVTADSFSRIYGQSNPTFTSEIAGFVNSDPASVVTGQASCTTTATTSSPVTTYPITCTLGSLAASNYSFQFVSGTLTLTQATPSITWAVPAAITYGTALSGAQRNASSTVAGAFTYTPASGILTAGSQTLSVLFTPTDGTDYTTATSTVQLQVNQATPMITWATPAAITYGTAVSSAQLNASSTVAGTFAYSPSSGTLGAGSHTLSVTFTPADGTDYTTATSTVQLQVNQATPTITWATPAPFAYGTALSGTQLNATASVAGTFSYNPASGTVLTAGSHLLSVTFTPTDTTDYTTASAVVTQVVTVVTPTITWASPAAITYGTHLSATQLNATASVAGSYSYNPALGTVLSAGSHTLSLLFTPTDTTDYTTASAVVTQVVTVVTPTITWASPAAITYGTHLSATQLNATASVAGTFSYNPASVSLLAAGTHTLSVLFTPTDTTDYTTATATASITVTPIALTITAGSPTTIYGSTLPTIAPIYNGFISGDSAASSLTTQPTCTTTATSASNVGSYPTSCSGAVDANYTISYKPGTLTVTPAVLTVAANKLTFAYGGGDGDNDSDSTANPTTYTITGYALGQTAATDFTGTPSETSNTPEGGPVGSYTITMAAGSLKLKPAYSSNYTISYVSAPLTIVPAVLTVTATSQSDVYGGVDPDNCGHPERHQTYTITGFAYNQKQNQVLDGSPTLTTTATAKSNVGSYPITITQGSLSFDRNYASDYTLVFVNGTVTVTPAKLYVVANSYSRQINQPNPAFGYTINGFVNGDTQSSATTGAPACCSTTAVTGSPAGIYAITIAPGSLAAKNGNYTLNFVNGVLVVYNPRDRNDPHCDRNGNYRPNPQYDNNNWPDNSSYNFYWGNGGGPNINNWN